MKLNRHFCNDSIDLRALPKRRILIAIIFGLASAFAIYGFAYMLRESFRLMSHGLGHLPNILSESERNLYNWFFAAISTIFGNSIALSLVLSGPHKVFEKRNFKRRIILNNQSLLNTSFAFSFLKVGYILGIFSMSFTDFNFADYSTYIIILLLIVMYLETWKTLNLILGKNKFKYTLVNFLVLFVFSFGLSKFEFINYKSIDANQLKYSPILDLPRSEYQNVTYFDNYMNVYLDNASQDKLLFDYYENNLNDSHLDFLDYKLKLYRDDRKTASIRICADRETKMGIIKSIEKEIKKSNIDYVIYGTFEDNLYATRFSENGIKIKLKDSSYFEDGLLKEYIGRRNHFFKVESREPVSKVLRIEISDSIKIDGKIISVSALEKIMYSHINPNTVFEYHFSEDTRYQDYISVLSCHLNTIELIRKKNSEVSLIWDKEKYRYSNIEQFMQDQQKLRDDFPFRVVQIMN